MKTFYLQQHEKNGRWIIDSTFPQYCSRVQDSREASEWLEAKQLFGYPLSPIQQALLEKHKKEAAQQAQEC